MTLSIQNPLDEAAYDALRYSLIKQVEESGNFSLEAYVDSVGIPTIGLGFNMQENLRNLFLVRIRMFKLLLIFILSWLIPTVAFSLEYERNAHPTWDYSVKQKEKCSKGGMREMNVCLEKEFKKSDAKLNKVYSRLMNALENPEPLKNAQRAWMRFRNLQCEFEVPSTSEGSIVPYSRNSCLINLTVKRILDLEQIEPCNGCVEFKKEYY